MIEWVLLVAAFGCAFTALGIQLHEHRRERRYQRDKAFAMAAWESMARSGRIRPKVDRRVQRRRYAR